MVAVESDVVRDTPSHKHLLKALLRTFYDRQLTRIIVGNRIAAHFRVQLGQQPGRNDEDLSPEAKKLLERLKEEYKLLALGISRETMTRKQQIDRLKTHQGILSTPEEMALCADYLDLERSEGRLERQIAAAVEEFPIWKEFCLGVRGCGPLMAAVLIATLDPAKARHPSQYWAILGLDVVNTDGRARSKRKEHLILRTYLDRDGHARQKLSTTYDPWARTKILGVLGTSFVRLGDHYRKLYDDKKHFYESHPVYGLAAQAREEAAEAQARADAEKGLLLGGSADDPHLTAGGDLIDGTAEKEGEREGERQKDDEWGDEGPEDERVLVRRQATRLHRHRMAIRFAVKIFILDYWRHDRRLAGLEVTPTYPEEKLGLMHETS